MLSLHQDKLLVNKKEKLWRRNSGEIWGKKEKWSKKGKCRFTVWYFQDRPFIQSEEIYALACEVFKYSGFDENESLSLDEFIQLMKKNHELVHPLKSVLRYDVWSERYKQSSDSSSESSTQDSKELASKSNYSKAAILDMNYQLNLNKMNFTVGDKVCDQSETKYITRESDDGPIEFFTTKVPVTKQGFLLKYRAECDDYVKRYYFLKNNFLYHYGKWSWTKDDIDW